MLNDIVAKTEATRGQINVSDAGLEFGDFNGLWRLAKWFHAAGWTPKGIDTVEKIAICIARGRDLGLRAMQALDCIGVVNGRPMVYGDAPLAVCRQHKDWDESGFKEWIEGEGDNMVAVCTTLRRGATEPRRQEFSVKDAKAAGLWGKDGPWKLYSKRMLMFRARGYNLRDNFGDALKGLGIRELADDADDPILVPNGPPIGTNIRLNGTKARIEPAPPAEPVQAEPRPTRN